MIKFPEPTVLGESFHGKSDIMGYTANDVAEYAAEFAMATHKPLLDILHTKIADLEDAMDCVRECKTALNKAKDIIEEVHAWAVCAAIAPAEDMMQHMPRIIEITTYD